MQLDVLLALQKRGRFFWEVFPGAKVSDDWQQQQDLYAERELVKSPPLSTNTADDPEGDRPRGTQLKE